MKFSDKLFDRRNAAMALHALSLLLAFAAAIYLGRNLWFFYDEWDFLANRATFNSSAPSIWAPHNEHWSTIPILIYRVLFAAFGLRTYIPFLITVVAFHLVLVHVLWRLLLACETDPLIATALAGLFGIAGSFAQETFLWAFQIGLIGSLIAGFAFLLLFQQDSAKPLWDTKSVLGVGALVSGLMFSALGMTMVLTAFSR